jgi:hypothetical protein
VLKVDADEDGVGGDDAADFRGRLAAVEPQLNGVLFELRIELLPGLLGLDHRLIHSLIFSHCLFLPVSAKSAQPQNLNRRKRRERRATSPQPSPPAEREWKWPIANSQ